MKPTILITLLTLSLASCGEETPSEFLLRNYARCNYLQGSSHAEQEQTLFLCKRSGRVVFKEYYKLPTRS